MVLLSFLIVHQVPLYTKKLEDMRKDMDSITNVSFAPRSLMPALTLC